jgi:CO/xanthine dehydrogenase Mo-binding subunit
VDAAVADAVFHARGKRFRTLPITPAMLLSA